MSLRGWRESGNSTYEVAGPVALLLTTTAIDIDEELLSRCIVLAVDEGREQTRAIHAAQRHRRTLDGLVAAKRVEQVVKLHHDAQRLLRPLHVVLPADLGVGFCDHAVRNRRDHGKLLGLIEAVAFHFQANESHALRLVLNSKKLREFAEPILPIHDGIVWTVEPDKYEKATELITKAMAFAMLGDIEHPLADAAATITVGQSWGEQDGSTVPPTEPMKRRSELVREGLDLLSDYADDLSELSENRLSAEEKLAIEFAALDEPGEFDVRVAAVATAKGGRAAAVLLRKVGQRVRGEVQRYLDRLNARAEAADAIEVKVFDRGDHVELGRDLARQLGEHAVRTSAGKVRSYREETGAWHAWDDEVLRQRACDYAGELREGPKGPMPIHLSDSAVKGIVAQAGTALYDATWEPGSGIAFTNGFLGAELKLKEHAAEHDVLAEHVVPYGYEPTARPERFLRYLDEVFAQTDADDRGERIRFLREHLGASLLGQGARYHRHPVLVGPGGNGKSVFLLVVEGLFPSACRATSPPHTWGDRFGRAQLQHAKVNLVAEVPNKTLVDSESVKGILAGDPVEIERKYKDKVTMRCRAGHIFAANELPPTVRVRPENEGASAPVREGAGAVSYRCDPQGGTVDTTEWARPGRYP